MLHICSWPCKTLPPSFYSCLHWPSLVPRPHPPREEKGPVTIRHPTRPSVRVIISTVWSHVAPIICICKRVVTYKIVFGYTLLGSSAMSYCNQTPFPLCKGGVWAWDYCWPCWMWTKKLCMRINVFTGWTGSLTTKLYSCAQLFWFTFSKINPNNWIKNITCVQSPGRFKFIDNNAILITFFHFGDMIGIYLIVS